MRPGRVWVLLLALLCGPTLAAPGLFHTRPAPMVRVLPPSLPPGGWAVPAGTAAVQDVPATLPVLDALRAEVLEVQRSRDARWTRVALRLHNSRARPLPLGALPVSARGDQGSVLATLPGLYTRAGTRLERLDARASVVASCWIALPAEGRGDLAVSGVERAVALQLGGVWLPLP